MFMPRKPVPEPANTQADDEPLFAQNELFDRDLSEVHMLLDFVSGRTDKSLAALTKIPNMNLVTGAAPTLLEPYQVIEQICEITHPPSGNIADRAKQAAFILMVKDELNNLADPSRGLTVAFTQMFAGMKLYRPLPFPWLGKRQHSVCLAESAYPQFVAQARRFRRFYNRLPVLAVMMLVSLIYANWDIKVSSRILADAETADAAYATLLTADQSFTPDHATCKPNPKAQPQDKTADKTGDKNGDKNADKVGTLPQAQALVCLKAEQARHAAKEAKINVQKLFEGATSHLRPVGISKWLFAPALAVEACDTETACEGHTGALRSFVFSVDDGLNSVVIPTVFGLLGTLAGLVRSIALKVRCNVLAPRDYQVARMTIFLGMTAGLAVGLFFNSTDPGGGIAKTFGGPITITAAGLSFMAGFGAETFFTFIEGIIKKLMPAPAVTK